MRRQKRLSNRSLPSVTFILNKNWCDAFFFPFEKVANFRPEMDAPMRVQTCLMNLKRSIFDEDEENLELAVLKMEKIPKEFLEVRELDILDGTS